MKILFTPAIIFITLSAFAQNSPVTNISKALIPHAQHKTIAGKDTVIESDTSKENKEPRYYYFSALTNVLVNTKGGLAKRFSPGFEFGELTVFLILAWVLEA